MGGVKRPSLDVTPADEAARLELLLGDVVVVGAERLEWAGVEGGAVAAMRVDVVAHQEAAATVALRFAGHRQRAVVHKPGGGAHPADWFGGQVIATGPLPERSLVELAVLSSTERWSDRRRLGEDITKSCISILNALGDIEAGLSSLVRVESGHERYLQGSLQ